MADLEVHRHKLWLRLKISAVEWAVLVVSVVVAAVVVAVAVNLFGGAPPGR